MNTYIIAKLLDDMSQHFPDISETLNNVSSAHIDQKLEALADSTTSAFDRGNIKKAKAQLAFVCDKLEQATGLEQEFIAQHYIRHLFWQASERAIEEGWPKVPARIKHKYLELHGAPPG